MIQQHIFLLNPTKKSLDSKSFPHLIASDASMNRHVYNSEFEKNLHLKYGIFSASIKRLMKSQPFV